MEGKTNMNKIYIPMLNLHLNISPVALNIGNIQIYWYAIIIVCAVIIALLIYKKNDGLYKIKFLDVLDLCIYMIPISVISARIYYVIFNLSYYLYNPIQILNLRSGGLAIYGGIIGGALTCYIFCKKRRIQILDLIDYIAPTLALRTSNRKMGKFYKRRSIWNKNNITLENGNI